MSILKIAKMGHPILRLRAEEIQDPFDPEIQALIKNMLETMEDADGLGLAAPQVYVPKRLVIFFTPTDQSNLGNISILINPKISPLDEEVELGWEGCLSVPGLRGLVPRYKRIEYSGLDQNGKEIYVKADNLHARVVQHECDHLDGYLYPQRMKNLGDLVFESELKHQKDGKIGELDGE
tara:strand:- start:3032 stop:3568 length:537 start_codon:yes stop_codon:yes gene_type:complete